MDVMLDLETLGTSSDSVVLAVGAVEFSEAGIGRTFYEVIDPQTCVDAGLRIDASTVMWWMQQSDEARAGVCRAGLPLDVVLRYFREWLPQGAPVWGNGATFDNVIWGNAYRKLGESQPWAFYNDRCYRTLKNLHPNVPFTKPTIAHNALEDALAQARHAVSILYTGQPNAGV